MTRWLATLTLAALVLALAGRGAAGPADAQGRGDGLDQPLAIDLCGAGAPGETHFTLAATGDTFPHETIQAVAEARDYDYLFDHIRPFLRAADLAYTNFDGAMLEGAGYTGYPAFTFNPRLAAALKNAGIGLVSTANNHILDRGPEGLDATLDVLARNGIQQHGAVKSTDTGRARPPFLQLNLARDGVGVRVAFLSFTWGTNGIPDPYGQVNLLWQSTDYGEQGGVRQSVLDAVAAARRAADVVVVAAHWGEEYESYPTEYQKEGAAKLAAAGADVILGAQSHTLQPVDVIDTGGRKTLVIYSLANFLAAQGALQEEYFAATSVVFYVGLLRHSDGRVTVSGYRYLPTLMTDDDTRPAPIPARGNEREIAHVRLMMRDVAGKRQLSPAPPAGRVEVCPRAGQPVGPPAQVLVVTPQAATATPAATAMAALGAARAPVGAAPAAPEGSARPWRAAAILLAVLLGVAAVYVAYRLDLRL
jgi:poly-gamma-glutamate capsule biosynthesis protein CapA/YwtB (metallophosphatase superfamily)